MAITQENYLYTQYMAYRNGGLKDSKEEEKLVKRAKKMHSEMVWYPKLNLGMTVFFVFTLVLFGVYNFFFKAEPFDFSEYLVMWATIVPSCFVAQRKMMRSYFHSLNQEEPMKSTREKAIYGILTGNFKLIVETPPSTTCTQCGFEMKSEAGFCNECGAKNQWQTDPVALAEGEEIVPELWKLPRPAMPTTMVVVLVCVGSLFLWGGFMTGKLNQQESSSVNSDTVTESSQSDSSSSSSNSSSSSSSSSNSTTTAQVEEPTSPLKQIVGNVYYAINYATNTGVELEILSINDHYFAYLSYPYEATKNGDPLLLITESNGDFSVSFDGGSLRFSVNNLGKVYASSSVSSISWLNNTELETLDQWLDGRYQYYNQNSSDVSPLEVEAWYPYLKKRWFGVNSANICAYDSNPIYIVTCNIEIYRVYDVDYTFYTSDLVLHRAKGDLMQLESGTNRLTIDGELYYN